MEPGKYYLFACPFFWTFVGRYVKHTSGGEEIVIDHACYFTVTGATFDILCRKGFQSGTKHHAVGNGQIIPAQGPKFVWRAPTKWVNPDER